MDTFNILFVIWGVIVLATIISQYFFFYMLKNQEKLLWESFGKPSPLNATGFFSSTFYVLRGKYKDTDNTKFINSCVFYRITLFVFFGFGCLFFLLYPVIMNALQN